MNKAAALQCSLSAAAARNREGQSQCYTMRNGRLSSFFLCAHKPSFILPSKVKFVGAAHVLQNARNLLLVQCFLHSPFSVADYHIQACSVSAAFNNSYIKRSAAAAHAQTCDGSGCMGSRTQGDQPPPHARTQCPSGTFSHIFFPPPQPLRPFTFVTAFRFVFSRVHSQN